MNWIKRIVLEEIKRYGTNDPFEISSEKGIILREFPLKDTFGFYMYDNRHQIITLNEKLNQYPFYKKLVMAHELGHAILHPKANTPFLKKNTFYSVDKIEIEANKFTVELLLPDDVLRDHEDLTIYEASALYGIPQELIALKRL